MTDLEQKDGRRTVGRSEQRFPFDLVDPLEMHLDETNPGKLLGTCEAERALEPVTLPPAALDK